MIEARRCGVQAKRRLSKPDHADRPRNIDKFSATP
jgi:hypothetical protein